MANGARKGVRGNYFHETTLAELYTIHMNLHAMEFSVKHISWKSQKFTKFMALKKRVPYGIHYRDMFRTSIVTVIYLLLLSNYKFSGGCVPRPLRLGSTTNGNPLTTP